MVGDVVGDVVGAVVTDVVGTVVGAVVGGVGPSPCSRTIFWVTATLFTGMFTSSVTGTYPALKTVTCRSPAGTLSMTSFDDPISTPSTNTEAVGSEIT